MWLINTKTLRLKYFSRVDQIKYAILSHRWEDEEVSFQEMQARKDLEGKKGYAKIQACCKQAKIDGYIYAWIDTCCIDKTSSAELSEAINSMFAWYQNAAVCYVYLSDVPWFPDTLGFTETMNPKLGASLWFTRGWTLQELLAPRRVEFYVGNWKFLQTKNALCTTLNRITGISCEALLGRPLSDFTVGEKMSWAAGRTTTRPEDRAYSLLGLFDVHLPLLYGEGGKAFQRLQETIIETNEDYTIFAWPGVEQVEKTSAAVYRVSEEDAIIEDQSNARDGIKDTGDKTTPVAILATSPDCFSIRKANSAWTYSDLARVLTVDLEVPQGQKDEPPANTSRGVRLNLPLVAGDDSSCLTFALTSIGTLIPEQSKWLCVSLAQDADISDLYHRVGNLFVHEPQLRNQSFEMREIYAAKSMTSLETTRMPKWRATSLLDLTTNVRLGKALQEVHLPTFATSLTRASWCPICVTYSPILATYDPSRSCLQCDLQTLRKHDSALASRAATPDQDPRITKQSNSEMVAIHRALRHFQQQQSAKYSGSTHDMPDLHLYSLLSNVRSVYKSMNISGAKLFICCAIQLSKVQRLHQQAADEEFLSNVVDSLDDMLHNQGTIGTFAIRVSRDMKDSKHGDVTPPYFELMQICQTLTAADAEESLVVDVGFLSMIEAVERVYGRTRVNTVNALRTSIVNTFGDVVFRAPYAPNSYPFEMHPQDLVPLIRLLHRSWSRYPPQVLLVVFQYIHAAYDKLGPVNPGLQLDHWGGGFRPCELALLLRHYCIPQDEPQYKHLVDENIAEMRKMAARRLRIRAVVEAVIEDASQNPQSIAVDSIRDA